MLNGDRAIECLFLGSIFKSFAQKFLKTLPNIQQATSIKTNNSSRPSRSNYSNRFLEGD